MKPFCYAMIASLLIFSGITPLHAQKETFKGELFLGAGAGSLFSKVDFVPSVPLDYQQGLFGGVSAKYISEKHLGLIAEINYAQRGWKERFDPSSGFSYNRTLRYIEIPLMTHIYAGEKTRFIVNAGPQISLLLGENQKMSQALSDDLDAQRSADPDLRIGEQYKPISEMTRVDYGLIAGLGISFQTAIGSFDIEGRYYFGLGDIFTNRRSDQAYFSRSAYRMIGAKITYYTRFF